MKFRRPRFSMRMLLIGMLVLGTGLGFLGRRLIQIRSEADRQLEVIRKLEERGFDFHGYRRGPLEFYESIVYAIDRRTPFTQVSRVTLPKGQVESKDILQILTLPELQIFNDFHGSCTDADLALLANCPTLTSVNLANWKGTSQGAKALFRGKVSLVHATFGFVHVDDEFLQLACRSRSLESLSIQGGGVTAKGIGEIKNSTSLFTVTIHGGSNLGTGLATLGEDAKLSQLWLTEYRFAEDEIGEFAKLHSLRSLNLECDQFPSGALQALGSCKRLEALRLAGELPSDEKIQTLACRNLQRIQIDDLEAAPENLFRELAKLPRLTHISLPKLGLESADLDMLCGCRSLESLSISATGASVEAINRLQRKLPNCTVAVVYSDGRVFRYPPGGAEPQLLNSPQ